MSTRAMKRAVAWVFSFVLLFSLAMPAGLRAYEKEMQEQARAIAKKLTKKELRKIAVVDFGDLNGDVSELGRFLAEELSTALANSKKTFEVIDRLHIKALLAEHKLASTGLINPQDAKELGKITGVDTLITGSLTKLSDTVRLHVKVLDLETAEVVVAVSTEIPETDAVKALLRRGIGNRPAEAVTGTPLPRCESGQGVIQCSCWMPKETR